MDTVVPSAEATSGSQRIRRAIPALLAACIVLAVSAATPADALGPDPASPQSVISADAPAADRSP